MQKHHIYQICKDYLEGRIDKHAAMDMLDLDHVSELLGVIAALELTPPLEPASMCSRNATGTPLQDFFTDE